MNSKRMQLLVLLAATLVSAISAQAFTFSYGDVLLVFRANGNNNVEFNLGNIGQFLNHSNGYQATVTGWSPDVVNDQFALTNGIAQFFVLATSSDDDPNPTAWITDSQPLTAPVDDNSVQWEGGLFNVIGGAGFGAQNDPNSPVNTNYDVVTPTSLYAFDFIASNNNQNPNQIPLLGGRSGLKFSSAGAIPGSLLFYAIQPTGTTPKPPATLIGSFTLAGDGTLTFQAGPLLDAAQIRLDGRKRRFCFDYL